MSEIVYVTEEGLAKMKEELNHLVAIERPNASKAIGEAREKGDLSENAEYDAAKEAQGLLELRIRKLEGDIGNARVLDASKIDISKDHGLIEFFDFRKITNWLSIIRFEKR